MKIHATNQIAQGVSTTQGWQKMAWLGDGILYLYAGEILLKRYPDLDLQVFTVSR